MKRLRAFLRRLWHGEAADFGEVHLGVEAAPGGLPEVHLGVEAAPGGLPELELEPERQQPPQLSWPPLLWPSTSPATLDPLDPREGP